MSGPRTILFVSHEVAFGGAERSLVDLLSGVDRDRYRPVLATSGDGPLADAVADLDVPVHRVPMLFKNRIRKLAGLLAAARALRRLVGSEGAALVHTNSVIAGYCGLPASRLARVPLVWHLRDIRYPDLARRAAGGATAVIANSKATAATLPRGVRESGRVRVVYNGVSPAFFDPPSDDGALRKELDVPAAAPLVGMVGRLDPWKGHAEFLRAAALVAADHPSAVFLVVGGVPFESAQDRLGGYEAELRELAAELGIAERVRFLGHRPDVLPVVAALDLLVHPSREPEPFGRSIAEAQAAGIPVVGTSLGGIPEIIENGKNGFLVTAGDEREMADATGRLLADPDLARRLGDEGRRRAKLRFTVEQHAESVMALYDEVLDRGGGK